MLCSLPGASLIDMGNGTKTAGSSLFSHGLKIAVVFAAFPELVLTRRIAPGVPAPRWYARAFAVMANTSPGDISHSDSHSIFKVQVLLLPARNRVYV